ncbi:MAG: hypothetical protein KAS71_17530 [Bacteroidales bacterium]|nr:hypothetical protein [Bacteroidales bacterium]
MIEHLKKRKLGINSSAKEIHHNDLYKIRIFWDGGQGDRIPAWARYVDNYRFNTINYLYEISGYFK